LISKRPALDVVALQADLIWQLVVVTRHKTTPAPVTAASAGPRTTLPLSAPVLGVGVAVSVGSGAGVPVGAGV
jgi:hypothetical protein